MKYEFHPVAGIFPLIEGNEFELLKEDIRENGLREDIWLGEGKIIDGRNRYRACLELGIPPRFREWDGRGSLVGFVISLNLRRRHLDAGQRAFVALRAKPFYDAEAKKRQLATLKHGDNLPVSPKMDRREAGRAAEFAGRMVGVGRQYIYEAAAIAEDTPEVAEEILKGTRKFAEVVKERKKEKRKKKIEAQLKKIEELGPTTGEYDVIVVDPPWPATGEYDPDHFRAAPPYPTMTISELENLKLPMAENCIVWVWGIERFLHDALHVIEKWGLEKKGTVIWVKDKFGVGSWLRNQHEYVFLAVRGKPIFKGEATPSILHASRGRHSEKPEDFYKLVERTCPAPRKLDYFARKKREGWDVYGDEVKK